MNRCASIKNLMQIKDVDQALAKKIRYMWRHATRSELIAELGSSHMQQYHHTPGIRHLRRVLIDRLIGTYGVEHIGVMTRTQDHVYYCNAGDTYDTTILFHGQILSVGDWGTLIERNLVRPFQQL